MDSGSLQQGERRLDNAARFNGPRNAATRKHAWRVVALIVGHKAALTILLFLFPVLFPKLFGATGPAREFKAWDTGAYLDLARSGYDTPEICAFYPLWPACIKLTSWLVGGHELFASYVVANILSLGGLLLFHCLVSERHGLTTAYRSTLLLLLFPGAMFFFVPYSESLFLFLLMACLVCIRRDAYVSAAAAAFLLPLTRATGIFVIPLIAWQIFSKRASLRAYALCLSPLVGYASYFVIMYYSTGNAMAGITAQQVYPAQASIAKIVDLPGFVHCFLGFGWRHDFLHSFLDRFVFLAFLVTLFWLARLDVGYFLYALLAGLVPALSNSLMSFTRFITLVFPVFIVWGMATKKWASVPIVLMLFLGLQVLLLLLYASGAWAG